MSQEKVDKYKEYKQNRKKILKKEKIVRRLELALVVVIVAGFLGWFGFSIYRNATTSADGTENVTTTTINTTALDNFFNSLSSEDTTTEE